MSISITALVAHIEVYNRMAIRQWLRAKRKTKI